ncbi:MULTISPECIES: hypothetical protein [Leuconostoc]|uniref:Uncharacterized protein n=1 Tax=Leuconostoc litchii TaxID=1981069 RepID=A0A6P2CLH4_9LACO|nr:MULTISPECIES: hypothetical protein [Leuconostoc]MBZ1514286.1 hypothetical protein [Leuconostoc mesenteroides]TDV90402.1 hypothetical protein C7818_11089 [Leuconostoc mesenteroides]TYC46845.1 hypothetical protein ESZ47_01505 [Leuconostoc litchii]GMA70740.1 hypothetical protein GCM10025879_19860 [Leuconostoc litchii]GMA70812.1 hypothetical protein GCM10025879_20580 [Leuconostoc litchii]
MGINKNTTSISGLIRMLQKYEDRQSIDMFVKHNAGGIDRPITQFQLVDDESENVKLIVKDY